MDAPPEKRVELGPILPARGPGRTNGCRYNRRMSSSPDTRPVGLLSAAIADVATDLLFLPVCEGEDPGSLIDGLGEPSSQAVTRAVRSKEFQAKPFEIFILQVVSGWQAARVALIACGRTEDIT